VLSRKDITVKVQKFIGLRIVGNPVTLHIQDGALSYQRKESSIEQEACLDGIYVVRTGEPADRGR